MTMNESDALWAAAHDIIRGKILVWLQTLKWREAENDQANN